MKQDNVSMILAVVLSVLLGAGSMIIGSLLGAFGFTDIDLQLLTAFALIFALSIVPSLIEPRRFYVWPLLFVLGIEVGSAGRNLLNLDLLAFKSLGIYLVLAYVGSGIGRLIRVRSPHAV